LAAPLGMRWQQYRLGNYRIKVKRNKDLRLRINMCWEVGDEKKCVTLSKEEAYATKKWVEDNDGVVFWTQVLPN
jgi:hypothetical protein